MLTAVFTACSSETESISPASRTIHFSATIGPLETRALSESGDIIAASWAKNEKIALIYSVNGVSKKSTGTVDEVVDGKATIKAELDADVADGAEVNVIYPASAADETAVKADLLTNQDGSLASISTALDVRTGSGTLAISANNKASFRSTPALNAAFAICKFSIKNNDQALKVDKLTITSNSNLVTTVTPADAASTLYIALKPSTAPMKFTATSNGSTYLASATAKLTAGHFYKPTMNMTLNVSGGNSRWMENLRDDFKIGAMSIPGAHAANCNTLTQDLSIEELWKAGVRAFDIHTEMVDNTLYCKYQGNSSKTVETFFGEIISKLDSNPREFALVLVYEPTEDSVGSGWINAFRALLKTHHSYILDEFHCGIILSQVRNKIVLLSRPAYYTANEGDMRKLVYTETNQSGLEVPERAPIGGLCLDWNNSDDLGDQKGTGAMNKHGAIIDLWTQDYCNVANQTLKSSAITNMMDAAIERDLNEAVPSFVLNYTSVIASSAAGYRASAGTNNKVALDKLNSLSGSKGVGVVFMDYAGVDNSEGVATYGAQLVQKLIDRNPKSSN